MIQFLSFVKLIYMDGVKYRALVDLCDELTTSGELQLDQRKLKELKKICRLVDKDLRC